MMTERLREIVLSPLVQQLPRASWPWMTHDN